MRFISDLHFQSFVLGAGLQPTCTPFEAATQRQS